MTRRPSGLRGLLLALLAALLAAPGAAARADDGPDALQFFESRLAVVAKSCADKLWESAAAARSAGFHQMACETAELLLEDWSPDHAEARKLLGYEKKGGAWVADPSANVQRQNMKNQKESQSSYDKRLDKWKESRRRVDQFLASKYAAVGAECAAKGYREQATKAAERALALDPDCEPARKALGYEKLGRIWVTKAKAEAVRRAAEGTWVEETSKLEEGLGVKLHKIRTPHFRIEDDGAKDALPEAVKALETLYAYYLADVGRDPTEDVFGGKTIELCVVSKKEVWEKWVDAFSGVKEADRAWLKESNTYRNLFEMRAGTLRVETAEHVDTRDPLLHHAAHLLNWSVWRATRVAWLDEGLAYYYTVKVQETTRTHCVAKEEGGYGKGEASGGDKDWTVSERWKPYLKTMVSKKNDEEFRKILNTPLATLDLPSSVKAWSLVSWLMDTQREKFLEFLKALRDRKDPEKETQEAILERIFATSIEALDKEWRAYALRAF